MDYSHRRCQRWEAWAEVSRNSLTVYNFSINLKLLTNKNFTEEQTKIRSSKDGVSGFVLKLLLPQGRRKKEARPSRDLLQQTQASS